MALPSILRDRLRLPVIASPLFIISTPDLVIAQCKAGIVGSFPSLNARPVSLLDEWLHRIREELAEWEREVIGSRTKDALAAARERGTVLGRPVSTSVEAEALIRVLRGSGESLGAVARALNDHAVPTAHGGSRWYPSTVRAVERRMAA